MERGGKKLMGSIVLVLMTVSFTAAYGQEGGGDKTLSPYFLVTSENPGADQLPLKATSADVSIAGVIAKVAVTQVYKNEGKSPIEAIYVFPGSTRAAVNAMKMTIGERTIVAKIEKREEARQQYEDAKRQGRSASLLEQQRPNVFQMNVANIMPGDEIKVEMEYSELLVPEAGVYEFAYPTVVGPRYSNQPAATAPASEKWVANPYTCESEKPLYTFDIKVTLAAGMPIQDVTCNSHDVDVSYRSKETATVRLAPGEKQGGNKDFILKYRLAGGKVEAGLLLYKGEKENFFLLMAQPPERAAVRKIMPREYIFIVDISGSMHGYPLEISKKLLRDLIGGLTPFDTFNVVLFAGSSSVMSPKSLPATKANIDQAIGVIDRQQGGGGTELLQALEKALALPRSESASRTVVIATDGYVTVEPQAFDLIRNRLGDANMFAFGIGTAVNRHLIEGIAHVGMGEPFVVTKQEQAQAAADKFRTLVLTPVLSRVKVDFGGFNAYDVEPPAVPDVLAERPVIVFGKWRGEASGRIKVSGFGADGNRVAQFINVADSVPTDGNSALRQLWARHKITLLADYNNLRPSDERVKEVTSLGLTYNLLTAYTSFIAVDSQVRNKTCQIDTVKQPLPLPEGVSNYAVGGQGGAMPAVSAPMPSPKYYAPAKAERADKGVSFGGEKMAKMGAYKMQAEAAAMAPMEVRENAKQAAKEKSGKGMSSTRGLRSLDQTVARDESAAPSLNVESIMVSGGHTTVAVTSVVAARLSELAGCSGLNGLSGKLVLSVTIGADGSVKGVKVVSGLSMLNWSGKRCVERALNAWRFGPSADGKASTVTITLARVR